MFSKKVENMAIIFVFLTVCPLNVRKDGQDYYSRVGHQRRTASHPASLPFPAATDAISRLRNFDS